MGLIELLPNIAQSATAAVIASAWQGVLLAAVIWLALKWAPKMTANLRFMIWMGVFLAVVLLPVFSWLASSPANGLSHNAMDSSAAESGMNQGIELDLRWALALGAIWLVFSLVRAVGLVWNAFRLRALWASSTPIDPSATVPIVASKDFFRSAQLCTSTEIDQPCVIGFLAPRILVPAWLYEKATPTELEQVVLHEIAHLRRFDDWTNLFQKIALVFFPLNPVLVWLDRRLASERERACDESVVRATRAPRDYATCLANLAEEKMHRQTAALSLGAWERQSELAGRIHNILLPAARMSALKTRAIMAALLLSTVGGAFKLGSSASLVSFVDKRQSQSASVEAQQTGEPRAHLQDMVYREPASRSFSSATKQVEQQPEGVPAPATIAQRNAEPQATLHRAAIARPSLENSQRGNSPMRVQTVVFTTQWKGFDGQHAVTVIQRVVTIPAESAAQSQSGWYVIQL